jgi:hypothetical protein
LRLDFWSAIHQTKSWPPTGGVSAEASEWICRHNLQMSAILPGTARQGTVIALRWCSTTSESGMSDRRQAPRFALSRPAHAQLQLAHDVVIERSDPGGLTVLATTSSVAGERFALRMRSSDGRMATVPVCTRSSRLVMLDGATVRYRLELDVLGRDNSAPSSAE